MLDEDDQPIEVMDCVVYGASETYEPYDDSVDFSGLKQGDVLNFRLQDGKIIQYEKLCSLSEPFEPTYIEASSGIQNSRRSIIYAPLVSVSSTGFVIVGPEGRPSNNEPEYDLIGNSFNNNSTRVTVYNVRERTVKPGSPASIYANAVPDSRGNISVDDTTTRVLLRRRWGYAAEVVFVIY